jgi:hypothetical protein
MSMTIAARHAVAYALFAALAVGCGGDVDRESSNRGSGSDTQDTTVENAYIVPAFVPGSCALQTGAGAELRFTVTNNRLVEAERLTSVSTDAAKSAAVPDAATVDIPAGGVLTVGQPQTDLPASDSPTAPAVTLTELDPDAKPATSTPVTFTFDQFGPLTVRVPIEACPTQQR